MRNKIIILIILFIFIPVISIYASGDKIICPVCGAENPKGAKFCWKCGAPLTQTIKKKKVVKKKITPKIVPTDSLLQTLKEIKDLLKEIKEELKQTNIRIEPKIHSVPEDTFLNLKIPKEQGLPIMKKKPQKKGNNATLVGTVTGCLVMYLMVLILAH